MNKKLFALLLTLVLTEVLFNTSVIQAVNGGACCPPVNNRCCWDRPYGYPRWMRCKTNCGRLFRPKKICCPRYRCCPVRRCCPTVVPPCPAYPCAEQVCQGGYSEPLSNGVTTGGIASTEYTNGAGVGGYVPAAGDIAQGGINY